MCINVNGKSSCPEDEVSENKTDLKTTDSFTFTLKLIDPCENAEINIDPSIISPSIYYGVYKNNLASVTSINRSLITTSPSSDMCPELVVDILHADGTPLNEDFL